MPASRAVLDRASWITHPAWAEPDPPLRAPVLRRVVELAEAPETAELLIVGLGVWEATIGGEPVSDAVLEPGASTFRVRVAAVPLDVAHLLRAGRNELVLQLGEGAAHVRALPDRYTKFEGVQVPPRARVALVVRDAAGRERHWDSGADWQAMLGPATTTHWYGGEDHDARLEPPGWLTRDGTADEVWTRAAVVGGSGDGPGAWRRASPPVRVVEVLPESGRTRSPEGVVVDLGRNIAGRQVLQVPAAVPAGTRIEMRPAEHVGPDGSVDQSTTGAPVVDSFTAAGSPAVWRPRFGYHGFRYVELRAPGAADPVALCETLGLSAERVMTDDDAVGHFRSDDPVLNGVDALVVHAIEGNLVSMPTDCPHREKLGWLEQLHLVFGPVAFRYDVRGHWTDALVHMRDAQTAEGLVPDTAPELVRFEGLDPGFRDDVNWGSAIWRVPYLLHREYGDLGPARDSWHAGMRYLAYLEGLVEDDLLDHGLADWITLDDSTPRALCATHGLIAALDAAASLADALGRDATGFRADAARHRRAVRDRFVSRTDDGTLRLGSGSQASIALLLDAGVLDEAERAEAGTALVAGIYAADAQITVGEIGLPPLLRALTALGEHELLHRMVTRTDGPGYGRMLADGCTALAEHWTGRETNGSANHFMLGAVADWFTASVAGLAQHPDSTGWDRAVIAPAPLAALGTAEAVHVGGPGRWSARWHRDGADVVVTTEVPEGGTAELVVPNGFTTDAGTELAPGATTVRLIRDAKETR